MIDRRISELGVTAARYSEVRESLALVVTELINNAVGETPDREIRIRCSPDLTARIIKAEVWDSSDRKPTVVMPDLTPETLDLRAENYDDNGGWGLPLVQALSTGCGVEPRAAVANGYGPISASIYPNQMVTSKYHDERCGVYDRSARAQP
jgi:hypothetical protein